MASGTRAAPGIGRAAPRAGRPPPGSRACAALAGAPTPYGRWDLRQMRIGITTYLKLAFSGMVMRALLLASASSNFTMSWSMLARASIR